MRLNDEIASGRGYQASGETKLKYASAQPTLVQPFLGFVSPADSDEVCGLAVVPDTSRASAEQTLRADLPTGSIVFGVVELFEFIVECDSFTSSGHWGGFFIPPARGIQGRFRRSLKFPAHPILKFYVTFLEVRPGGMGFIIGGAPSLAQAVRAIDDGSWGDSRPLVTLEVSQLLDTLKQIDPRSAAYVQICAATESSRT